MKTLPCPFDGEEPVLHMQSTLDWIIQCPKCKLTLPPEFDIFFTSKEVAIKAWNSRVYPLEIRDVLQEALDMLEIYYPANSDGSRPTIDKLKAFLNIKE